MSELPGRLVVPLTLKDNDGNEQEIDRIVYVLERTTTRNTTRKVWGNPRPVCEVCGYGIGDKRWSYCPKCGAKIVEADE